MVKLTINNRAVCVPEDTTILEAAKTVNVQIPTLCHLQGVHSCGVCRICIVEIEGVRNLQVSCIGAVREGMHVHSNTPRVRKARKILYELMLSDHPKDCLNCSRGGQCELQRLGEQLGVAESRFDGEHRGGSQDSSLSIVRDPAKCILCRRCITACNEIQQVGAICAQNRGFDTIVAPAMALSINDTACTMCGQCVAVCPTGALREADATLPVWQALENPDLLVVAQVAPAVRAALGEEFGFPIGASATGKLAASLKELGFDKVFDTNFAADLTILEEGAEFLQRLTAGVAGGGAVLPLISSCSPGWIKHIEHAFPNELDHLSTCKSPHTMLGALVKSYYAEKLGIDPNGIFMVSVMPCTAKKYEIRRPEMGRDGIADVDAALTTRELAGMIRQAGIDFLNLEECGFDEPLGFSTGAADIFGVTGGVTEAALRTVYELVTGAELPFEGLHVAPIVGPERIKTAEIIITDTLPDYAALKGVTLKIAVTSGLAGADILLRQIASGSSPYHFIEVMGCPGGCINGGGQPRSHTVEGYCEKRAKALYQEDENKAMRKSHENPAIACLYEEYLGEVGGDLAHKLLHTHYTKRGLYNELT